MMAFASRAWMPVLTALLVVAVYGTFHFGRHWPIFLGTIVLFLFLLFMLVLVGSLTLVEIQGGEKPSAVSGLASVIVALVAIPTVIVYGQDLPDPLQFLLWSQIHGARLEAFAGRDGVVEHWDGWGFAGLENDSYLVSDPSDAISGLESANHWAQARKLGCEIVATQRMRRGFYILTTLNCEITLHR